MTSRWSGYNNAGVCATAILAVLAHAKRLPVAKALLIMPLVMHDATVQYMGNARVAFREVASLVAHRPDLFANFNSRFEESIAVSVNAIQWIVATGYASFDGALVLLQPLEIDADFGKRVQRIEKASEHIAAVLTAPVDELYLNFRVQL
ncbi:three component ABC system middle component [Ralstonia pseudosolanacearum]|uniref:three component ABC system middle component n=1 Tax=Ralstonia pseudosolanacearum TaxID=1310165 RepID=UPI0018D06967|nr:three component ABC system middle component [Ralstonia pseudosolanacearum]